MIASYLRETRDGTVLRLRVQPNAKRNEIVGLYGEELKIRLHAPPVEGRANEALVEFLSELLDVPENRIVIVRGETGRSKQVLVSGKTAEEVLCRLNFQQSS